MLPPIGSAGDTDRIINILIQLGLSPESVTKVREGLLSVDDAVKQMQKGVKAGTKSAGDDVNTLSENMRGLMNVGRMLTTMGHMEHIFGRLFDDKDLERLGQMTRGIGQMVLSIGHLRHALEEMSKMAEGGFSPLLAAGAVLGGGLLGAAAYDKFVGPQQQTFNYKTQTMEANSAGNILGQTLATLSYGITNLYEGADKANQAFVDTARQYGILKTAEEEQADAAAKAAQMAQLLGTRTDGLGNDIGQLANKLKELGAGTGGLLGSLMGGAGGLLGKAAGIFAASDPAVKAYADYQNQITKANQKYGDEQVKINDETQKSIDAATKRWGAETAKAYENYMKQEADSTRKLGQEITKIQVNAADTELKAQQTYYDKRSQLLQTANIELQRMEETHRIEARRAQEDHNITIHKLAEQLDAGAIEDENQKFRIEQRRKEEDYRRQVSQKDQDIARTLAQEAVAFEKEQDLRKEQEAKQIADLRQNEADAAATRKANWVQANKDRNDQYTQEITNLQQNGTDKLDTLAKQHQDEMDTIDKNWTDRRQQLGLWLAGEKMQFYDYMKARQDDLQQWVNTHLSIPGVTGGPPTTVPLPTTQPAYSHQLGGYQKESGWAYLHGNEFVMSAETARKAEQIVGGPLTQQNVTGGPQIIISQSFSGQESDPATYERLMYKVITDVFTRARQLAGGSAG